MLMAVADLISSFAVTPGHDMVGRFPIQAVPLGGAMPSTATYLLARNNLMSMHLSAQCGPAMVVTLKRFMINFGNKHGV